MGLVKEPQGVDFIIKSPPLSEEEQREISAFIKMRKAERARQEKIKMQAKTRSGDKSYSLKT